MGFTGTQVVRGAYRLMGRPSQDEIRYQDVMDNARQVISGAVLDLKLANRNRTTIVGSWVTPAARTESTSRYITEGTMFLPAKCQWRYLNGEATQIPSPVEFAALESLDDLFGLPQTYVAIYNNDTEIAFSEKLSVLETREYRLIYEGLEDVEFDRIHDEVENFPDGFVAWAEYKTALLTINQVENDTEAWAVKKERLLRSIVPMFEEWDERLRKWAHSRYGNRKAYKPGWTVRGRRR